MEKATMTAQENHASPGSAIVHVEPTAESGRYLAHVGSLTLPMAAPEGEKPRVRDLDLGKLLGFDRPRAIRSLIKRMIRAGKLKDIHQCHTVERREGQVAPQAVTEFWLTREQALLVATQSDTPRAWELTETMVQVFDAVLEFCSTRVVTGAEFIEALRAETERQRAQVRELVAENGKLYDLVPRLTARIEALEVSAIGGVIGADVAKDKLLAPIEAALAPVVETWRERRSLRMKIRNKLRNRLGFNGPNSDWAFLPRALLALAERELPVVAREVIREFLSKPRRTNGPLFEKSEPAKAN